ncbi:uncharacterized protein LOC113464992, partial [Ceratina calcarata]|uniref:Uncharacterized protein LOC113464992 n=1 Tax=Ceratina calcarata TaxID=156304 RepID=A0AAJ7SB05_9HYME
MNLGWMNLASLFASELGKLGDLSEAEFLKFTTSFQFSGPIDLSQKYFAKYNVEPIYYQLSYKSNHSLHMLFDRRLNGTGHTDDLDLLFNIRLMLPTDPLNSFNLYRK